MKKKTAALSDRQLKALVGLMDEEDPDARAKIMARLKQLCNEEPQRILRLKSTLEEKSWSALEILIQDAQWDKLEAEITLLAQQPDEQFDLERGVYLVAKFASPELKALAISKPLNIMAEELKDILEKEKRPSHVVQLFNRYLFESQGFKGNESDYYDPENSYFNRVLDRRLGIPITLGCLYLFLARRLSLPLAGVGMPGHFLVHFRAAEGDIYIDPFRKGRQVTLEDCKKMLSRQGIPYRRKYLMPTTDRSILVRMISNLIGIYSDREDRRRAQKLATFVEILDSRK